MIQWIKESMKKNGGYSNERKTLIERNDNVRKKVARIEKNYWFSLIKNERNDQKKKES